MGSRWFSKQLQRLLAPNQVSGPHLARECVAVGAKFAFTRMFFSGESGALRGPFGAFAADIPQGQARLADRDFRGAQLLRQAVAFHLFFAHLARDALDLGFDLPEVGLGLAGVALRVLRQRRLPALRRARTASTRAKPL